MDGDGLKMKKKNEKKTSWWVQAKEKQTTKIVVDDCKSVIGVDPAWNRKGPSFIKSDMKKNGYSLVSESYYSRMDDIAKFENEYYLSPIYDEIDGLRKKIDGLTDTLRGKNDKCAVLQTSLDMLNHAVHVDEAKRESAEKVADWAVKKLLIELIGKSDEIDQLERKVKEFKFPKAKSHVADRLIGIIDKKDHMIRYLMNEMEKLKKNER